mgnify:CR=1 FL=1
MFKYFYFNSNVRQFRSTSFLRLFKNFLRKIMYHPYVEKNTMTNEKWKFVLFLRDVELHVELLLLFYVKQIHRRVYILYVQYSTIMHDLVF